MFFKDYIERAIKTESNDFDAVGGRLNNKHVVRLLHACLGMVTETSELFEAINKHDLLNIREELGDLFWYLAVAYDSFNAYFSATFRHYQAYPYIPAPWKLIESDYMEHNIEHLLFNNISALFDVVKKNIFYGKQLERNEILYMLQGILNKVCFIVYIRCLDLDSILNDNIEKLKSRYGESFSEERALNRDVENELSHMKDKV